MNNGDLYGKGWLLFHYLTFEVSRKGQMAAYLRLINEGKNSRDAGLEAFGDFAKLEEDLREYLERPRLLSFKLPPEMLRPAETTLRTLPLGEAAMMQATIRMRLGANPATVHAILAEARAVASRFPGDPVVQAALAEAERNAGNNAEAVAAADAALAIDRSIVNAYVQKGYAQFQLATKDRDPEGLIKARETFMAASQSKAITPYPCSTFI